MDEFIVPDWPAPTRVRALSTTRCGGTSDGVYAGLNLGDHVGDLPVRVAANRARLRSHLPAEPVWLRQVHGARCVDATTTAVGAEADACLARVADRVCAVMTADCLPVLLCDRTGSAVAAAHAGWRGLAMGVLEATVAALTAPPGELLAWLGPAIGPRAFEVGDDVRIAFVERDAEARSAFVPHRGDKWFCDLYALARLRLRRCGVNAVFGGEYCTHADGRRFYSHRRDGVTGRMATLIWLEDAVAPV